MFLLVNVFTTSARDKMMATQQTCILLHITDAEYLLRTAVSVTEIKYKEMHLQTDSRRDCKY